MFARFLTVVFLVLILFGCEGASKVQDKNIQKVNTPIESENRVTLDDVGAIKIVSEKDPDDLEFLDDSFKIEIDKYTVSELKVKEEFKAFFKDDYKNTERISIVGIWLDFENITGSDIALEPIKGTIETNSGEVQDIVLQFEEESSNLLLKPDEDVEGSVVASFSTEPELITEVIIRLEGLKEISFSI